jgi:hypothetical protein
MINNDLGRYNAARNALFGIDTLDLCAIADRLTSFRRLMPDDSMKELVAQRGLINAAGYAAHDGVITAINDEIDARLTPL